jgi:hypothetical protein
MNFFLGSTSRNRHGEVLASAFAAVVTVLEIEQVH